MKKWLIVVLALIAAVSFTGIARAVPVGATAKFGTLGLGAEVAVGVSENINARAGLNGFSLDIDTGEGDDEDGDDGGEDIDASLKLQSFAILADWYPWEESAWRVSGGIVFNNNRVEFSADVDDTVELNDREYAVDDFDGELTFNAMAPYLGIGYGNPVGTDGRWHFAFDFGLMFQGDSEVDLDATATNPAEQPALERDLKAEEDELDSDIKIPGVFPVVCAGISYRF